MKSLQADRLIYSLKSEIMMPQDFAKKTFSELARARSESVSLQSGSHSTSSLVMKNEFRDMKKVCDELSVSLRDNGADEDDDEATPEQTSRASQSTRGMSSSI